MQTLSLTINKKGFEKVIVHRALALLFVLISFGGITQVDSLTKLLKRSQGTDRADVLNELAWELAFEDGPLALHYSKQALAWSSVKGYQVGTATSYARIGLVYDYEGRWDKALECYQISLDMRITIGDSIPISNAWNNLGAVYQMTGKYGNAMDAHMKALEIREIFAARNGDDEDLKLVAQSLNNIAAIHRVLKNYDVAIMLYKRSLKIKRVLEDYSGEMLTLSNLAIVYQSKTNYEAALSFFLKAYKLALEHDQTEDMGHCLNNMGITYISLEQYDIAEEKFESALTLARKHNDVRQISTSYANLAELYFEEGKFQNSIEFANKCLQLSDRINFQEGKKNALYRLMASYEALGDFQIALQYHKEFTALKDTLLNKSNSDKILELSARYDNERKENKIDMLTARANLDQTKLERRNAISFSLGVAFLLVFIVAFFMIKNSRGKKALAEERAEQAIERHQKEIDLLRANIQNQLIQVEKFDVGISKDELNLYLLNPLSDRELDVMFLLADGKSNKEISEDLFVSVNTIKTHVLKIYDKLDVQNRTQAAVKAGTMNLLDKKTE